MPRPVFDRSWYCLICGLLIENPEKNLGAHIESHSIEVYARCVARITMVTERNNTWWAKNHKRKAPEGSIQNAILLSNLRAGIPVSSFVRRSFIRRVD